MYKSIAIIALLGHSAAFFEQTPNNMDYDNFNQPS